MVETVLKRSSEPLTVSATGFEYEFGRSPRCQGVCYLISRSLGFRSDYSQPSGEFSSVYHVASASLQRAKAEIQFPPFPALCSPGEGIQHLWRTLLNKHVSSLFCDSYNTSRSYQHTVTAITQWKRWLVSRAQTHRPNPLHDEYQSLVTPAEPSSRMEESEETTISSSLDHVYTSTKESRPSIVFDSPISFVRSVSARFASLWTPSFTYAFLGGQLLSLSVTCSSVTTSGLVEQNWVLPSTQIFFS